MVEEREGSETAPSDADVPYSEPARPARQWSRATTRMLNGRNKRVVTPAGVYGSAAQAADAYGYSRSHAAHLAREGLRGWRWFEPGVDVGEAKPIRGRSRRPAPPQAKRVRTPLGLYESATLAGLAHGISRQAASKRARLGLGGWAYD